LNIPPIAVAETLIRHVHPKLWPDGQAKPNSGAFRDRELSVDREVLRSIEICCRLRPTHGFMRLTVSDATDSGLTVVADPLPSAEAFEGLLFDDLTPPSLEHNPAHAIIRSVSRAVAIALIKKADVVFRPGECPPPPPQP